MSGSTPHFRKAIRAIGLLAFAVTAPAALLAISAQSDAQAADTVGCTKICAQIVQAIGDDIKEQIPLECVQTTGSCTGTGYFQTEDARVPVTITGLLSGDTLTFRVAGDKGFFAPVEQDSLVMKLQPDNPYQASQFVVGQRSGESPFANAGTSLTVTIIAERQM